MQGRHLIPRVCGHDVSRHPWWVATRQWAWHQVVHQKQRVWQLPLNVFHLQMLLLWTVFCLLYLCPRCLLLSWSILQLIFLPDQHYRCNVVIEFELLAVQMDRCSPVESIPNYGSLLQRLRLCRKFQGIYIYISWIICWTDPWSAAHVRRQFLAYCVVD